MATQAQQLFRAIVVHNKLMNEADLDALLASSPDPEQAIGAMVARKIISAGTGSKLLALYKGKLDKLAAQPKPVETPAPAAAAPAAIPHQAEPEDDEPHEDTVFARAARAAAAAQAQPAAESEPAESYADADEEAAPTLTHGGIQETIYKPSENAIPLEGSEEAEVDVFVDGRLNVNLAGRHLLHALLKMAREAGASDLHIKSGAKPIVRKASALHDLDVDVMTPAAVEATLKSCLTETQRRTYEKTNDLDFCYDAGPLGRFRTSYLHQLRGMDGIFRIIPSRVQSFEELRLPEAIKRFCDFRQGIILITGPKASGKTTTMAAFIDLINSTRAEHIITVEDPIEFVHPCKKAHVNQREVGAHTESFSNALRAALREAPDVIMVGEMRDLETTSLAITAAETGHLVFATLHTPDAVRTIGRVLDVFPPEEQSQIRAMFSESLRGIVSQLLIPSPDGTHMELATEIMFNTPAIGNIIRENRTYQLRASIQTGKKLGMLLLDESLINLVKEKRISKAEALTRSDNPTWVEKELTGLT